MKRRSFGRAFRRGRTWHIRYRVNGVEYQERTGPTKKLADDLLADIQAKLAKEETLGVRVVAKATLAEVWKLIEPMRRARLSERGFQVQRDHIEAAIFHFGTRAVRDIRPQHIEDYLTTLASAGRKGSTVNRHLTSLSAVLAEAVERGFARENVALKVERHRSEVEEAPFVGEGEIRKLLAAAQKGLRPIIAILADTGLRRGELLSLAWPDVDFARGTVMVRRSKSGRGREVPLTGRARASFEELHVSRGPRPLRGEDLVFAHLLALQRRPVRKKAPGSEFTPRRRAENRLSHQFSVLAKLLGMEGVSLHSLRHSCASRMVMAGVPLSAVARVTGHSTLRCAALYGRHAPKDAARMAILALEASAATSPPDRSNDGSTRPQSEGEATVKETAAAYHALVASMA